MRDLEIGNNALEFEAIAPHPNPIPARGGEGDEARAITFLTITFESHLFQQPELLRLLGRQIFYGFCNMKNCCGASFVTV